MASAAVAGSAALLVPTLAAATPLAKPAKPATAASVQAKLTALAKQNNQLVEKYNQARLAVTQTEKAVAAAQADANAAQTAFLDAQTAMSSTVAAQYESGSFSTTGALLSSDSGQNYIQQLTTLDMISAHYVQVVQNVDAQRVAAEAATQRVTALLATNKSRLADLAQQRKELDGQILQYRVLLASLTVPQRAAFNATFGPNQAGAQFSATLAQVSKVAVSGRAKKAVDFALKQLGKPYSWGAAGPDAYDCSGLTMASWAQGGLSLPHSAEEQSYVGKRVSLNDLQPGDLLFYYQPIGHVTIYVGDGMAVSAPTYGEPVSLIPVHGYLEPWMATNPLG